MRSTLRILPLVALVVACSRREEPGLYTGTVEFPDVQVGSLVGGRVLEVLKREGETAQEDDILVRLDPSEWQSVLEEAAARAEATRKELDLLVAGPRAEEIRRAEAETRRLELLWTVVAKGARPEEIAAADEDVRAAQALLNEAGLAFERESSLQSTLATTSEAMEKVVAAREVARARLAAAIQRAELLKRGSRPEEVEAARQSFVAAEAKVAELRAGARPEEIAAKRALLDAVLARKTQAETKLRELTIRAPAACFVQSLDLRAGDLLAPNQPVAVLLLADRPWITIYVPEKDLAKVSLGQRASITPDGLPALDGTVTWISRRSEYTPRNVQTREERVTQVFAVKIEIAGDVSRLKDGLWADVRLP